jgi:hypothetical protein
MATFWFDDYVCAIIKSFWLPVIPHFTGFASMHGPACLGFTGRDATSASLVASGYAGNETSLEANVIPLQETAAGAGYGRGEDPLGGCFEAVARVFRGGVPCKINNDSRRERVEYQYLTPGLSARVSWWALKQA